jgi:hypothetical protein
MVNFTQQSLALFCQMLNLEVTGYRPERNHYSWKQISKTFFNQLIFLSLVYLRWDIYHILSDYDHFNNQDLKNLMQWMSLSGQ